LTNAHPTRSGQTTIVRGAARANKRAPRPGSGSDSIVRGADRANKRAPPTKLGLRLDDNVDHTCIHDNVDINVNLHTNVFFFTR